MSKQNVAVAAFTVLLIAVVALLGLTWPTVSLALYTEELRFYAREIPQGVATIDARGEPTGTIFGSYQLKSGDIIGHATFETLGSPTISVVMYKRRWNFLPVSEYRVETAAYPLPSAP